MRNSIKKKLIETINKNNFFDYYDFEVEADISKLIIKYKYSTDSFYLKSSLPNQLVGIDYEATSHFNNQSYTKTRKAYQFNGEMKPGYISRFEKFTVEGVSEFFETLEKWLIYLKEELLDTPFGRDLSEKELKIDEINEKINNLIEENSNLKEMMTKEEILDIENKLTDLENTIIDLINKMNTIDVEKTSEIESLKQEISSLKVSAHIMTKESWSKKFMSKLFEWSCDSEKQKRFINGGKFLLNVVKVLGVKMPDEIQLLISSSKNE